MVIGELLGKFEHEVRQLSPDEIAKWLAYIVLKDDIKNNNRRSAPISKPMKGTIIKSL